ncbi:UNVERIFIED_CONTAM: hypothetical protein Scaly_3018500 [Sesamum calycinum]|uniref:ATP-dependent DNA helicase n=1 Tax=Sesamum calycinum TaxID=2727403 RepID=A0AAW2KEE5_9LAMI
MLWEENYPHMIEDYPSSSNVNSLYIMNKLLHDINDILQQHKKSIKEFDLPQISEGFEDMRAISGVIEHELSIPISDDDLYGSRVLNAGQLLAFDIISQAIRQKHSAIFFVDGPGGTGKTFLYRTLLANFRNDGCIILATATSGIAANLLPGGRTAHSKFKIPIKFEPMAMCRFNYMENRAIITPLNDDVNKLNEKAINAFPGEEVTYYSFDSVPDDTRNLYLPEFLNSISPGNLPPHKLVLKKGSPIMLLRNIDPKANAFWVK